jgi:hypothetical protein
MNSKERTLYLQAIMESLGFDTCLQSFQAHRNGTLISGSNVHGIFRAPRGQGTESLVISAPQYYDGNSNNLLKK